MTDFLNRIAKLSPKQLALLASNLQERVESLEKEKQEPIAIVAVGCRFPGGANSPEAFWRILHDGVDVISEVPADRWDVNSVYDPEPGKPGKTCSRYGGFLDDVDRFDALFFGISPREAARMDPQQRLLLEVAWETLENGGQSPDKLADTKTGVFIGICSNDYVRMTLGCDPKELDMYLATGGSHSIASGRLSYLLGLHGPSISLDTACSSSLIAVHVACLSLRARECRAALAGGVSVMLSPEATIMFSRSGMMAKDGRCKTFDASADGYVRGEGCGMVLLKRLSDAIADGDRILATIQGSAVNQDGRSGGITAPNGVAQQAVIREALAAARLVPEQIDYVETHGSGTSLGDPIEVGALSAVYGAKRPKSDPLYIGSVKTNMGHVEGAAGIAGLIKVVLALQAKQIPPHLHFTEPTPHIPWESTPIEVATKLIPWRSRGQRRTAAVSSFGFSGTNAHVVVAEAVEPEAPVDAVSRSHHLLTLSAKTAGALQEMAGRYAKHFSDHPELSIRDVCRTANTGRSHFEHRLATVASSLDQLRQTLEACAGDEHPVGVLQGHVDLSRRPEVVFLFAGQGGQYLQMARALYETEPVFRDVVDRCESLVQPYLEIPLSRVLYPQDGQASPLDETQYTHVAMFAVQYGLAQLWRSWGIEPAAVMGHSVGEIAASAVAGGMSMEDGLMLMRERGRLMHSLPNIGTMASLLAGEAEVRPVVERYRDSVAIAAINGPESTVISGERKAVEHILHECEAQGIKTKLLNVSNSFHSPLVEPVLEEFAAVARQIDYRTPHVAQFCSMRLDWVNEQNALTADYWPYNLRNTVRFSEAMSALHKQGYRIFLEIGPSPTLVGMGSQCVPQAQGLWLPSLRRDRDDWEQILESLGTLYVNGVNVDWPSVDRHRSRPVPLPTYPFQRERFAMDFVPSTAEAKSMADVALSSGEQSLLALAKAGASLRAAWIGSPDGSGNGGVVRLLDDQNQVVAEFSCVAPASDTAASTQPASVDDLNQWTYQVEWEPKSAATGSACSSSKTGKNWLLFADHGGVGESLASLLKERGDRCVLVFSRKTSSMGQVLTIDPARPDDFRDTIREIIDRAESALDGIIHLWSLDCPPNELLSSDSLRDAQMLSCGSVLRLVQSLAKNAGTESARLWVVTQGVQAVGNHPAPVQVAQGPVRGLCRVIAMEHPELRCVNVDLDPAGGEKNISSLIQELAADGDETQIALRQGARYVPRFRRTTIDMPPLDPVESRSMFFKPDATYLVTGGLGDLGMKTAQWLVARGARHVVLMGRRSPSAAARERLVEIQEPGVNVVVFQGDVSLRRDVERLLAMITESMPPLRGIIHAAGTWKGGVLLQQDLDNLLEVLAPKVEGAWNLHELTRSLPLDFFVSFSSGASVLGAAGLGDYAAANSFLDAIAHYRRAEGLPGSSINWGPWADLGMVRSVTSVDTSRWSEHGMSYIPSELALHALESVIRKGITQVSVLPIDWVKLQAGLPSLANSSLVRDLVAEDAMRQRSDDAKPEKRTPATDIRLIHDPDERQRILVDSIRVEAARILRVSVSKLDVTRSLNQYGMDSLMALELKNRMQTKWDATVSLAAILSGPPITELASLLMAKLNDAAEHDSDKQRETVDGREAEELLRRLPDLSDDDVDSILGRMMSKDGGWDDPK